MRPEEEGGVCDLIVLYPDEWVAFEFVRRTLTSRTLTVGDYSDLMRDLRAGVVEKLGQIDDTVTRLVTDEIAGRPRRVFSVVVVGGNMAINPVTWQAILKDFAGRPPRSLTVDSRCQRPVVLDPVDLRLAFAASDQLGKTLPQVLSEFLASDLAAMPFAIWFSDAFPHVTPVGEVVPTWIGDACRWIGLPQSLHDVTPHDDVGPA